MAPQEKPLSWRSAITSWRLLSPLKRFCVVAPLVWWLVMAFTPVLNTEWWLANNKTAFRVLWREAEIVAFLLSMATLIGFVTWATQRQNEGRNSK